MANELYAKNGIVIRGATSTLLIDSSGDTSPQLNTEPYQKALIIADSPNVQYNPEDLGSVSPTLALMYSGSGENTEGVIGPAMSFTHADDNNSGGHSSVIRIVKSDTSLGYAFDEDGSLLVIGTREADDGSGNAKVKEGIRLGHNQYTGLHYKPDSSTNPPAMLTIGTTASEDITIGVRQTTATINAITNYGQFYVKDSDGLPYFTTSGGTAYNLTEGTGGGDNIGNANLIIPDLSARFLKIGSDSTFSILDDSSDPRLKIGADEIRYNKVGTGPVNTMWKYYISTDNDYEYAGFKLGTAEFEIKLSGQDRHFVWTAAVSASSRNDLMRLDSFTGSKASLKVYGQLASTPVYSQFSNANNIDIDWNDGNGQVIQFDGSDTTRTINNPTNPITGATYFLKLIQDNIYPVTTLTWPGSVKWPGGIAPVLTPLVNAVDTVVLFYDGTNYYGNFAQNYS